MPPAVDLDLARRSDRPPLLVGVVHLGPLPGAPEHARRAGSIEAVLAAAERDARALARGGCDAVIVENFGDAPFFAEHVPSETVAGLALGLAAVRRAVAAEGRALPVGVNVLRNDARAALGLCASAGASFLRVNVHTGAAHTDQGQIVGRAPDTLRERERLCPRARILADVHVKHATPAGAESLAQAAEDTWRRGHADALILTGVATGRAPEPSALAEVRERVPEAVLLVGSGIEPDNAAELLTLADGAIVGTWLKEGGDVTAPVDESRVARLRECMR